MIRDRERKKRFVAFVACICIFCSCIVTPVRAVENNDVNKESDRVIVSLGDSFSAGEGIEEFYGQEKKWKDKVKDLDWLAHRSKESWPGRLTLPGVDGTMKDHRDTNWFFTAVSGAVTSHICSCDRDLHIVTDPHNAKNDHWQEKEYSTSNTKDFGLIQSVERVFTGKEYLPPQLSIFDEVKKQGKVADYVTVSIGGNDVNFSGVITTVVEQFGGKANFLAPQALADQINDLWKKFFNSYEEDGKTKPAIRDEIIRAYHDIEAAAGPQATIIVAGYPRLLDENGKGLPVRKNEAEMVNTACSQFDDCIRHMVKECQQEGMNIEFVSVISAFKNHGAYSKDNYINPVYLLDHKSEDLIQSTVSQKGFDPASSYSIHPNSKGAAAYAECVQRVIDRCEGERNVFLSTDFNLEVLDYDNNYCSDYTITIDGNEEKYLGIVKTKYHDEITVTKTEPVRIVLPEGSYELVISNGKERYIRKIKVRSRYDDSDERVLRVVTSFGETESTETGSTDGSDNSSNNIPSGAVEFNGHYYYLYRGGIASSYDEALGFCRGRGGYLATINSSEENNFLYNYIRNMDVTDAFFGLSNADPDGIWKWCTGEDVSFVNWSYGEPNNEYGHENYGMFFASYTDGTWNDGEFDKSAFLCEWGKPKMGNSAAKSSVRDVVLTLDTSGSMDGNPLTETKKASLNFVNTMVRDETSVGLVSYSDSSIIKSGFSQNISNLNEAINKLYAGGMTNMEAGLRDSENMLNSTKARSKIIVLMSDGLPNEGLEGEELINYANTIKDKGIRIYTLGFFSDMADKYYPQYLMERIASDGCHYEVSSAEDLVFFFDDIADQISGQKYIYIRIACPVDVSVTCDGETLDSSDRYLNTRTSFGTLTFEDNQEELGEGIDDRVKVLRLKEGTDYDLELTGTGRGIMNYTIGFTDENGDYSDLRKFENIKITRNTRIDTVASAESDESILNIDEDGDGKYDLKLRAKENGYGEEVSTANWMLYLILGTSVFVLINILTIVLYVRHRRKVSK